MINFFFVFAFIVQVFVTQAEAKNLELKINNRTIYVQEKKNWILGQQLFGMPFILFSPIENGQRSNISFTDTGSTLIIDIKSLASSQKDYQTGRRKWADKVGATPLSFSPYEVTINKHGHKVHQIGFSYEHEGLSYKEKSYYIECRGKIIFSKSLRLIKNENHDDDFQDLIAGTDCGGV